MEPRPRSRLSFYNGNRTYTYSLRGCGVRRCCVNLQIFRRCKPSPVTMQSCKYSALLPHGISMQTCEYLCIARASTSGMYFLTTHARRIVVNSYLRKGNINSRWGAQRVVQVTGRANRIPECEIRTIRHDAASFYYATFIIPLATRHNATARRRKVSRVRLVRQIRVSVRG